MCMCTCAHPRMIHVHVPVEVRVLVSPMELEVHINSCELPDVVGNELGSFRRAFCVSIQACGLT